jgi:putative ABC transport system permease protein
MRCGSFENRPDLRWSIVLTSAAKLGLAGCGIGTLAAVFTTRLVRSLLFEVYPLVIVLAALSIFLLAVAASVIPARRAAAIELTQALHAE